MSQYKLIALDMDGTLLNSKKEISKKNLEMIERAFAEGKQVALSTGRCIAELEQYLDIIPGLRYIVCVSGAMVYDLKEKRSISSNAITEQNIRKIMDIVRDKDIMIHFMSDKSIVQNCDFEKIEYYQMGVYRPLFEEAADKIDNIYDYYEQNRVEIDKLNLYHHTAEEREQTREKLKGLDLVLKNSEEAGLEISAKNVTKGTGLMSLCEHLGISIDETIAVGDADNDIDVLKTAGLSVAMGNADDEIKEICDVVVGDCDHDGCAEAIEKYLLNN